MGSGVEKSSARSHVKSNVLEFVFFSHCGKSSLHFQVLYQALREMPRGQPWGMDTCSGLVPCAPNLGQSHLDPHIIYHCMGLKCPVNPRKDPPDCGASGWKVRGTSTTTSTQ